MFPIRFLTIHCAATPEGRDVKAAEVNRWDVAKFGQVSYHWIIELDGTAVRGLQDNQRGAHVARNNTGNIGICYVGGMDKGMKSPKDTRTPAQRATMERLVREYRRTYPGIVVRGHNEWPGVKKACPSFNVPAWLREIG
jgi:N-acetylmuramoyl-L-alanine amidase